MVFSSGAATGEHLRAVAELIAAGELRGERRYQLAEHAEAVPVSELAEPERLLDGRA